jgi:hypothetical protein
MKNGENKILIYKSDIYSKALSLTGIILLQLIIILIKKERIDA